MARIKIVSFSGYGHTAKRAEALPDSARTQGDARLWEMQEDGTLPEAAWEALDAADAIVVGTPTCMAGPACQIKRFAEDSLGLWLKQKWKDKLMGGFTNSGSASGDKVTTLTWMVTFAARHGATGRRLWQGQGRRRRADGGGVLYGRRTYGAPC